MTDWYLKPWEYHQFGLDKQARVTIRVQIDPALVSGQREAFGPVLFLKYALPGIPA